MPLNPNETGYLACPRFKFGNVPRRLTFGLSPLRTYPTWWPVSPIGVHEKLGDRKATGGSSPFKSAIMGSPAPKFSDIFAHTLVFETTASTGRNSRLVPFGATAAVHPKKA
jgi:hypothetical protein